MCDNDNMVLSNESNSHLSSSSSMSNGPPPSLPQQPPPSSLSSLSFEAVASTAVAATKSISRPPDALLLEDMASENYWLRQKMKEITADRDRLLCEVANLRLELDMSELKRLPEDK